MLNSSSQGDWMFHGITARLRILPPWICNHLAPIQATTWQPYGEMFPSSTSTTTGQINNLVFCIFRILRHENTVPSKIPLLPVQIFQISSLWDLSSQKLLLLGWWLQVSTPCWLLQPIPTPEGRWQLLQLVQTVQLGFEAHERCQRSDHLSDF